MANATVLSGRIFYIDSGISTAERTDLISQLERNYAIITSDRATAAFIVLDVTTSLTGFAKREIKRVRNPDWLRRFIVEILETSRHFAGPLSMDNGQTRDRNARRPVGPCHRSPAAKTLEQSINQLKYTAEDLVRVADYVASCPEEAAGLRLFRRMCKENRWAKAHEPRSWQTWWLRLRHPKRRKKGEDETQVTKDNDDEACVQASINIACWRRKPRVLAKNSDASHSQSTTSGGRPSQSTGHAANCSSQPQMHIHDGEIQSQHLSIPNETLGSPVAGLDVYSQRQQRLIMNTQRAPPKQSQTDMNQEISTDGDYDPSSDSFDEEDYTWCESLPFISESTQYETWCQTSQNFPLSGVVIGSEFHQRGASHKKIDYPSTPDHITEYFQRVLANNKTDDSQLLPSQSQSQFSVLLARIPLIYNHGTDRIKALIEARQKIVTAGLSVISHWLQLTEEEVRDAWDDIPLEDRRFEVLEKRCLSGLLLQHPRKRRRLLIKGTTDDSSPNGSDDKDARSPEDSRSQEEQPNRTTKLRLVPINPRRQYPYPTAPGREWAKRICRMLSALYGCSRPRKVYAIWESVEGNAAKIEEILKEEDRQRITDGKPSTVLDLTALGVGEIPRPWI
ncbi:hypothetical protein FRC15_001156 [Serendipita sp. 397]|nr:hypothetical protein FRC15_001156 [Serendipita sp. 397]